MAQRTRPAELVAKAAMRALSCVATSVAKKPPLEWPKAYTRDGSTPKRSRASVMIACTSSRSALRAGWVSGAVCQ